MKGMSKRRVVSAATFLSHFNALLPCEAATFSAQASNNYSNSNNKLLLAFLKNKPSIFLQQRHISAIYNHHSTIPSKAPNYSISKSSRMTMMSSSANNIHNMKNRKVLTFDSLSSTQDETRNQLMNKSNFILDKNSSNDDTNSDQESNRGQKQYLAITTKMQTTGRGTSGRTWIGREGNTFVTITIPTDDLKVPITLLPLQIGIIIVKRIHDMIRTNISSKAASSSGNVNYSLPSIKVKWPNDVLVDGKKIAGVLIESDQDFEGNNYFLVGVGINYKYAPEVNQVGPERGRVATCIYDHIIHHDNNGETENDEENLPIKLGQDIAHDIWDWVDLQKNWDGAGAAVIQNFEYWTDFGQELILRDVPGNQTVRPIQVESDGRLKVKDQSGKERLLCVDYLL